MRGLSSAGWRLLMAVAATSVLTSCGGGSKTVVENRTVVQTASTASPSPPLTVPRTDTQPPGTPGEGSTPIVHRESFHSPTRNIGCVIVGGTARCDIGSRSWSPPPRPSDCPRETGYGQGAEVGASGPGKIVCAGDTTRNPTSPRLAYGTGSQVGNFECVSRPNGMTCTNRRTGHGFLINRERYGLF